MSGLAPWSFPWFGDVKAPCGGVLHLSFEAQEKFGDEGLHSRLFLVFTDTSSQWATQQGWPSWIPLIYLDLSQSNLQTMSPAGCGSDIGDLSSAVALAALLLSAAVH